MSLLPRLISASVAIADYAGKVIREVLAKGDLDIVAKEHAKDFQTKADRSAQKCIIGSLMKHFPKLKIIGEEDEEGSFDNIVDDSFKSLDLICPSQYTNLKEEDIVVWVDPLDGTAEYTQVSLDTHCLSRTEQICKVNNVCLRFCIQAAHECISSGHSGVCKTLNMTCRSLLDHVTVLIGIATGGKVIGGVIHQPYYNYQNPGSPLGRTIWSLVGGQIGGMDVTPPPKEGFIVTTTRSHSSSTVNDAVASVNPTQVLRVGGAGHKVLLLVEGRAHAYVFASPGCKKWDTCAPQAVLEAAGGKLTDISGIQIPYNESAPHRNSTGVLAVAPGINFEEVLHKIPQHVKENLKA